MLLDFLYKIRLKYLSL